MRFPSRPRLLLLSLLCASLLVSACTRSAAPDVLPTATSDNGVLPPENGQEATMAAIGTEVSSQLTQTAVAVSGGGGGEELTPQAPTQDPGIGQVATATPDVVIILSPTPGQDVVVATPVPPAVGGGCSSPYTVQSGDWIYQIARNCGVSANAIIAANPGINPHAIVPGQQLIIPGAGTGLTPSAPTGLCTGSVTVVRGDTLFKLTRGCGITPEQLAAHNGIAPPYTIFPGQVINFP